MTLGHSGLAALTLPKRNATAARDVGDRISPQDRAYLAGKFRLDIEIFGYAVDAPVHA